MLIYKNINETYGVFSPIEFAEFAPTWIELMMFRALLLAELVTSTNSIFQPKLVQTRSGRKIINTINYI